ncbi:hypothetical protein BACCAP_00580 [Pseudoflavonifractor capillosus ATCC 29799]|uniref:Uncharacterized protein n=1 Tax=Pseudoflavonifractor capillosus ATCC 29799 TaxID=411467 RepID=A6NQV7_9FIRM|nr:hypothetical protein BACCAP_00580 [Pseudoflavonifractor capillosus ATCC 29799]
MPPALPPLTAYNAGRGPPYLRQPSAGPLSNRLFSG